MSLFIILGVGLAGFLAAAVLVVVKLSSGPPTRVLSTQQATAIGNGPVGKDILSAKIEDVRQGGLISVEYLRGNSNKVNLIVDDYNFCKIEKWSWHELISVHDNIDLAIESHSNSGNSEYYEVEIHTQAELSDLNLNPDSLEALSKGEQLDFNDKSYKLEQSGDGLFHKTEGAFGRKFHYWFWKSSETEFLRVEKRPDSDKYRISTGKLMAPNSFNILKLRDS